ncbi:MAG: hypothetical protein ACYCOU_18510 [Sulfobacillus sp.]
MKEPSKRYKKLLDEYEARAAHTDGLARQGWELFLRLGAKQELVLDKMLAMLDD